MRAITVPNPKPFTDLLLVFTLVTLSLTVPRALCQGPIPRCDRFVEFDAPGAGTVPYSGTEAVSINSRGVSTGYVVDNSYGTHGFVRNHDGTIIVFDAPGASPVIGGTYPVGINDRGVIAGYAIDANAVYHGFLRDPDGVFTLFDAPAVNPGVGNYLGTAPQGINTRGEVAGHYLGGDFVAHGFLRAPDGTITVFDDPAGGVGAYQGTWAYGINDKGEIAGAVTDPAGGSHGFVRSAKGAYTDFDFPGETSSAYNSALINNQGVTAGYYADPTGFVTGYERSPEGHVTSFVPAVSAGATAVWTFGLGPDGEALGRVNDANSLGHAFIRYRGGRTEVFDVPGQITVSNPNSWGSELWGENDEGVIVGEFIDSGIVVHSFLLIPESEE
ncbi:MAG: hypothetical protein ABR987_05055 [Terracidiphilus sp.]|jgi:hypothetical protein